MARVRTEEMLKPGQNGIGDGLCRVWWWWVMPQAVGRRRRGAVRNSRRLFVTMAFSSHKIVKTGGGLDSFLNFILLPSLIRSPTR